MAKLLEDKLYAEDASTHAPPVETTLLSISVSLKRIADALNEPNEYGEVGSAALAGAIARGLRDR